jgi:activator of HSP90 ATPase
MMTKNIVQQLVFKNTLAKELYELYMNSEMHAAVTGDDVKITEKEGGRFWAFGGYIKGKNLKLVRNQLIVQTWRASDWNVKDADSTFLIFIEAKGKDAWLHMVHSNIPDRYYESISKGWHEYYWGPWKKYLAKK